MLCYALMKQRQLIPVLYPINKYKRYLFQMHSFRRYFGLNGTYRQNTFEVYKKESKNLHLNKNVIFAVE